MHIRRRRLGISSPFSSSLCPSPPILHPSSAPCPFPSFTPPPSLPPFSSYSSLRSRLRSSASRTSDLQCRSFDERPSTSFSNPRFFCVVLPKSINFETLLDLDFVLKGLRSSSFSLPPPCVLILFLHGLSVHNIFFFIAGWRSTGPESPVVPTPSRGSGFCDSPQKPPLGVFPKLCHLLSRLGPFEPRSSGKSRFLFQKTPPEGYHKTVSTCPGIVVTSSGLSWPEVPEFKLRSSQTGVGGEARPPQSLPFLSGKTVSRRSKQSG